MAEGSDKSTIRQTAIVTIAASSVSALIVGGLTGWFALRSADKQAEISRLAACYTYNSERAGIVLRNVEEFMVLTSRRLPDVMGILRAPADSPSASTEIPSPREQFAEVHRILLALMVYGNEELSRKAGDYMVELANFTASLENLKSTDDFEADMKVQEKVMNDMNESFARLNGELGQQLLLLRDPTALCR